MRLSAITLILLLALGTAVTAAEPPAGGVVSSASWGTLWQCVSTYKVMRDTAPPTSKQPGVRISGARNEFEAFQLVLRPTKALSKVTVVPHKLVGPKKAALDAWNITIKNVGYVNITTPTSADMQAGAYPDPLPDFAPFAAAKGVNTPVWVSVYIPSKTAPGDYTGTIDVIADGNKTAVPLKVHVYDFELPQVSKLRTAYGLDYNAACKFQGATTLEQKRKVAELYNLDFWRHRVAPFAPYTFYEIKPTLANGTIKLDYSDFDIAIKKYFALFNSFALPGFGMGDTAGIAMGDNYDQLKIEYMRMVTEHLAEKGQIAKGYNYIWDEPTEEQYKQMKAAADLCRMADARIKVLLTEQVEPALYDSVDIWVPVLPAYDEQRAKARQKLGEEVWWYVCCGPHHPYPNNFIDYPAIEQRVLPWISWRYGVTGILYWQTTYWQDSPYEKPMSIPPDGNGQWGNGDGRLIYPPVKKPSSTFVAKGPVTSIRWEMTRDGIEDYDYFRILQDRLEQGRKSGKPAAALAKAEGALKAVNECATSRTEFVRSPQQMEAVRVKVAEAIEGLK